MVLYIPIIILVLLLIIFKPKHRRNKTTGLSYPLSTICKKGILGICLSDDISFVLSRIKHLHLMTTNEMSELANKVQSFSQLGLNYFATGGISFAYNKYNNIDHISTYYDGDNKLRMLITYIKVCKGREEQLKELTNNLTPVLGKLTHESKDTCCWDYKYVRIVAYCEQDKDYLTLSFETR